MSIHDITVIMEILKTMRFLMTMIGTMTMMEITNQERDIRQILDFRRRV